MGQHLDGQMDQLSFIVVDSSIVMPQMSPHESMLVLDEHIAQNLQDQGTFHRSNQSKTKNQSKTGGFCIYFVC